MCFGDEVGIGWLEALTLRAARLLAPRAGFALGRRKRPCPRNDGGFRNGPRLTLPDGRSRYISFLIFRRHPCIVSWVKPLEFSGSSRDDLREFPAEARRSAGFALAFVQRGLMPSDWKVLNGVGPGAMEIRIHVHGEWRVIYVSRFADAIYVLHAFQKKSQKTRREDIEIARKRYLEIKGRS